MDDIIVANSFKISLQNPVGNDMFVAPLGAKLYGSR